MQIFLNILFITMLVSRGNMEAPLKITKYRNENLLAFEKLGGMYPMLERFEVKLAINLTDIANLGMEILNRIERVNSSVEVCKTKACSMELIGIQTNMKMATANLQNIMAQPRRLKRDAVWSTGGEYLQSFMGTLTEDDGKALVEEIINIETQQQVLVVEAKAAKDLLLQSYNHLKTVTVVVQELSNRMKKEIGLLTVRLKVAEANNLVMTEVRMAAEKFEKVVDGIIEIVFSKKVLGRLVTISQLNEIFSDIKNVVSDEVWFPFSLLTEVSSQRSVRIGIEKEILTVQLSVPAVSPERYQLFQAKPLAVVMDGKLIMLIPERNFIAVNDANRTVTFETIENCLRSEKQFFCFLQQPGSKEMCVERALMTLEVDEQLCQENLRIADIETDIAVRAGKDTLLVVATSVANFSARCKDGFRLDAHLTGVSLVTSKAPCYYKINNESFYEVPVHTVEKTIEPQLQVRWSADLTVNHKIVHPFPSFTNEQLMSLSQLGDKMIALNATDIETQWIMLPVKGWDWKQYGLAVATCVIIAGILYFCCFRKC